MNVSKYFPPMPYKVRELFDRATNIVLNYSETEAKLAEATNDEAWGPSGTLLQELSQLSYSSDEYKELINMLWKRCFDQNPKHWRRIYKSLLVLIYLCKNGSEKVVISTREHLIDLKNLENFIYYDERNKDQGMNIRIKTKELIEFIQDTNRISDERKRARLNRDKYIGLGRETSQNQQETWLDRSKSDQSPIIDLLGIDEDEFGPYQEAPSNLPSDNLLDIFSESMANNWSSSTQGKVNNQSMF